MTTADERAADKIGRAIDGQIRTLQNERATLLAGPARIVEIDAEIIELQREKTRIDPRRPPRPDISAGPVADDAPGRVR
jgi:hypothetical protein